MSTWLIIVAFVISFVFVEFSPLGIQGLKTKNGGFGAFDMTRYSPDVVKRVLECSDGLRKVMTVWLPEESAEKGSRPSGPSLPVLSIN